MKETELLDLLDLLFRDTGKRYSFSICQKAAHIEYGFTNGRGIQGRGQMPLSSTFLELHSCIFSKIKDMEMSGYSRYNF
jgi:hypothetical protein